MKYSILIILFITSIFLNAQNRRIETNIQKLDNSQFVIDHNSKAIFAYKSSAANKLIRIGKAASPKLIAALNDPNKVIMAHLVLCHIYFKSVSFAGPKEQSKDDVTIYKYYLGQQNGEGLIISEIKKGKGYSLFIEPKDLEDIITYWKTKAKG